MSDAEWWAWFDAWRADCRRLLAAALATLDAAEAKRRTGGAP